MRFPCVEEREAFLVGEIEHRSKNIFATVQAVAHRTFAPYRADLRKFDGRLLALSANHSLLHENLWQGIEIADLARVQLAHFGSLDSGKLTFDGPNCVLSPIASQALGMALHELATNAAKYGALSNETGSVDLTWRLSGENEDRRFTITWSEHGGPPVVAPTRSGFGSKVVRGMIESTMHGVVTLDFAPTGVIWRLECPLDGILGALAA